MYELNNQELNYFNSLQGDGERQGMMTRDIEMRARLNSIMAGQAADYFPNDPDVIKMKEESDAVLTEMGIQPQRPQQRTQPAMPQDTTKPKAPAAAGDTSKRTLNLEPDGPGGYKPAGK
jgi:hypothetical protein